MSAPHFRTTIRVAFVTALLAAGTAAADQVLDSPVDARTRFPALTVEDLGETQELVGLARGVNATVRRTLMLEVTAEVSQLAGYADARNALLAEVEAVIAALVIPGVKSIKPAGYAADPPVGAATNCAAGRQRFNVTYLTKQGTPGTPLGVA